MIFNPHGGQFEHPVDQRRFEHPGERVLARRAHDGGVAPQAPRSICDRLGRAADLGVDRVGDAEPVQHLAKRTQGLLRLVAIVRVAIFLSHELRDVHREGSLQVEQVNLHRGIFHELLYDMPHRALRIGGAVDGNLDSQHGVFSLRCDSTRCSTASCPTRGRPCSRRRSTQAIRPRVPAGQCRRQPTSLSRSVRFHRSSRRDRAAVRALLNADDPIESPGDLN